MLLFIRVGVAALSGSLSLMVTTLDAVLDVIRCGLMRTHSIKSHIVTFNGSQTWFSLGAAACSL
jgi:hypothetical protein